MTLLTRYGTERAAHLILRDGTPILIRPLVAGDVALYPDFLREVTAEDLRLRFFASMREVSHELLHKLINYDPARAMAFIAIDEKNQKMLGVVRLHDGASGKDAEFAILVRSRLKGHGVGWLLMKHMIEFSKHGASRPCEAKCYPRIPPCWPCVPSWAFTLPPIRTVLASGR
jgi:hypothetical protein